MKLHLQPLAIAANLLQASSSRLDHVLLTLANLYHLYLHSLVEPNVHTGMQGCLEKRWIKNADQDLFIIAVLLNPYIRQRVFRQGNPILVPASLYAMCIRIFRSMFQHEPDVGFHNAFWDYLAEVKEFSMTYMSLSQHKEASQQTVSFCLLKIISLTSIQKKPLQVAAIWSTLDTGEQRGRNSFTQLAIRILSIVPNSAGAERTFSQMALVHTKTRNRLNAEKVHKTVSLKMDLHRIVEEYPTQEPTLRKRKFQDDDYNLPENRMEDYRAVPPSSVTVIKNPDLQDHATLSASGHHQDDVETMEHSDAENQDPSLQEPDDPERFLSMAHQMIAETDRDSHHILPCNSTSLTAATAGQSTSPMDADDVPIMIDDSYLLKNLFNFAAVDILGFEWGRSLEDLDAVAEFYEVAVHEEADSRQE